MAFIQTIHPAAAGGAVAAMYLRQQSAWGYVPNYAKVFCHRPTVMTRWAELLAELRRPMDNRAFELVTFAAAHELHNSACTLAHGVRLRAYFDDKAIIALAARTPVDTLTTAEEAMLRFARRVAHEACQVTSNDIDELLKHGFAESEVFDIAAAVAARAFFTKVLDALGVEPDSPFQALETSLREALTVGRAIDTGPCELAPDAVPVTTGARV